MAGGAATGLTGLQQARVPTRALCEDTWSLQRHTPCSGQLWVPAYLQLARSCSDSQLGTLDMNPLRARAHVPIHGPTSTPIPTKQQGPWAEALNPVCRRGLGLTVDLAGTQGVRALL